MVALTCGPIRRPTARAETGYAKRSAPMPTLGWWELIVILAIVVLLFGSRKLPELARSVGKSIVEFKKGMKTPADEEESQPDKPETAEEQK